MPTQQITESTVLRAISDERIKLTDKEIFTSAGYKRLIHSIGKEVTGRTGQVKGLAAVEADILWEPKDNNMTAYTDNKKIVVNASHPLVQALKLRYDRHLCVIGAAGHEFAHCLFSDFTLSEEQFNTLMSGQFYPYKPLETSSNKLGLEGMQKWLDKEMGYRKLLCKLYRCIENTIEDAYVERSLVVKFPGIFKRALKTYNEALFVETFPTEIEPKKAWETFFNLLLVALMLGQLKFEAPPIGLMSELKERVEALVPRLERDVWNSNVLSRKKLTLDLLLETWDLLESSFGSMQPQEIGGSEDEFSLDDLTPEQIGELIEAILDALQNGCAVDHDNDNRPIGGTPIKVLVDLPPQESGDDPSDGDAAPSTESSSTATAPDAHNTGETTAVVIRVFSEEDTAAGGDELRDGLSAIETEIARERAEQNVDHGLQNALQKNANESAANDRYTILVKRNTNPPNAGESRYCAIWPELQYYAKRLKNEILKVLKSRHAGGKVSGLAMGRRINSRQLHREDERYFSRNKLPDDRPRVAVSILIDESGSMHARAADSSGKHLFSNKIEAASNAALLLYDFCTTLGFPVMVAGHTTDTPKTVLIDVLAAFQRIDPRDRFRIAGATASNGNRDGTALNYCLCELKKRPEEVKLLFILSDGLPSDYSSYEKGIQHLKEVAKAAKEANVQLYAAALDDDVETIMDIYGDRAFEMTDLARMPKSLLGIMQKYIK